MEKLKCKVVMLPAEKATLNCICKLDYEERGIVIAKNQTEVDNFNINRMYYEPQHLYFTSNREINCIKIEATTDPSLNLRLIPQSFIEKYVEEGGNIKEVMINLIDNGCEEWVGDYYNGKPVWFDRIEVETRKDNTVIVSKIKDSWTREEVIALCKAARSTAGEINIDEWFEQNL